MKLSRTVGQSMQIGKVFPAGGINAMDFSDNGETLVTSSSDDSISVYLCRPGISQRTVMSKKYGVNLVRFTHAEDTVVYASTKENDYIRYLSVHTNTYIRYFMGHTDKVTSLSVSPVNDTFLSASKDKTVRLWDMRSGACTAMLETPEEPVASFDTRGLIFGVLSDQKSLKLYDARNFEGGPFATFNLPVDDASRWTGMKFSNDEALICVTSQNGIQLLDSYYGTLKANLDMSEFAAGDHMEASFSPCSRYVFAGGSDGNVHMWNTTDGATEAILTGHLESVGPVQMNPKYMMLASACLSSLAFWVPTTDA